MFTKGNKRIDGALLKMVSNFVNKGENILATCEERNKQRWKNQKLSRKIQSCGVSFLQYEIVYLHVQTNPVQNGRVRLSVFSYEDGWMYTFAFPIQQHFAHSKIV
jgi:hypothetical protein